MINIHIIMTAIETMAGQTTTMAPAPELADAGVMELMKNPEKATQACKWICSWDAAKLAVATTATRSNENEEPSYTHNVMIQNADWQGNDAIFGVKRLEDGTYEIATVAGWEDRADRARLDQTQSAILAEAIDRSIEPTQ